MLGLYAFCIFVLLGALKADNPVLPKYEPLSDELINFVNSKGIQHDVMIFIKLQPGSTWRAALSDRFKSLGDVRKLLGARLGPNQAHKSNRPTVKHEDLRWEIPESFDSRERWPKCLSIRKIYDESSCASSWAIGAVSAMSDRMCIKTYRNKYPVTVELSARDLMACCEQCGFGCVGGWIGDAWDYWRDYGIVSGGGFGTQTTCLPYPFPPCNHNPYEATKKENCSVHHYATPKCERQCNSTSGLKYDADLRKGLKSYNVYPDAIVIQKEIWLHGPVEAVLSVYADLLNYKSGVYQHHGGELLGAQAVRILGWGVEEETPYWIVANSWNKDWGRNGTFKIIRGQNHCGIESNVVAGLP
ncbi:hypothetical protein EG68_03046 [Paragonimus skrjabini miyazakii]|uniref:Cathepsin B-like cysteine proteinase n=1 Tax=Paragonimus skrjabini miyazakii TaxID=59628 RepID=A0A8S9YXX1_9TREM|nr:hypothetical protein EG68_03046 [Paragonimus skrjabini miyazakii]